MKKKILAMLLAAFALVSMLAACGSEKPADKSVDQSSSDKPQTLRFWRAGTDPETDAYWNAMIAKFEETHPNVTVEYSALPWGDEIETKLNAAYASGTGPDVLQYAMVSIPQRASVGQYAALDDYIAKWDGKDDIFPNVLASGEYKGKTYGVGMRPDPRLFVWRKDMFEAAGLDPETPPRTWEELKEFADKLTIKENGTTVQAGYNMAIANGFQEFQIFLMQNGGNFVDADTDTLTYNSPEAVETLNFMNSMVQDGNVIPADTFQSGTDIFLGGKAAMAYKSPSDISNFISSDPTLKEKVGMTAPLSRKEQATFAGMGYMFMSEDCKNKDLAWEFIELAMSPDEMQKRADELGVPPVLESLKESYIAANPEMNQAIMDSIAVGRGAYPVLYSNELNETVSSAIEQVYYGKATAEEALNASVKEYQAEIDSNK